jgi:hypothetical protein
LQDEKEITLSDATLFSVLETSLEQCSFTSEAKCQNLGILSSFCTVAKFLVVFCIGVVYVAQRTADIHLVDIF